MRTIINILILFSLVLFANCEKETFEINTQKQAEGSGILKQKIFVSDVNSNQAQATINYEYFDNGKLKKTSYSHSDGVDLSYSDYEYNNDNQLEKIIKYTANSDPAVGFVNLTSHAFEYSINGLKIKETITHPVTGTSEHITFKYNSEQYLIKEFHYDSDNQAYRHYAFKYDEFGNLLKQTTSSATGEQTGETLHYYRDNMLVKSDVYILGKDKVHLEEIIKTYDADNNLIMLQSIIVWGASSRSSSVIKFIY